MHFLTDPERVQLKAQHRQERDGRVRDRIKAILLYDKDWSSQEIAEALLMSDQTVPAESIFGQHLRRRVRDKFIPKQPDSKHFWLLAKINDRNDETRKRWKKRRSCLTLS